jgi:hypothetical protein
LGRIHVLAEESVGEVVRHQAEFGLQFCVVQQELIADFAAVLEGLPKAGIASDEIA